MNTKHKDFVFHPPDVSTPSGPPDCQLCRHRPATIFAHSSVGGQRDSVAVCHVCYAAVKFIARGEFVAVDRG